jgi:hypothetical protein
LYTNVQEQIEEYITANLSQSAATWKRCTGSIWR